ncbi:MAG TPA: RNA methyltransferase, partial [Eubacteriaceae bacterium]|nr:RNA methyltransferase [Eubacteriaceae bacterium]
LKETLAAALVLITRWSGRDVFVDPFCGSGTIPIEAAMYACDLKPGANRSFISEERSPSLKKIYTEEKNACRREEPCQLGHKIYASDSDPAVIRQAKENAKAAGVQSLIEFCCRDVKDLSFTESQGTIITNPPYGERLLNKQETEKLYRDLKEVFLPLKGWRVNVLSGHMEFERHFGKKAFKNRKLYNGNKITYYFQYKI